MIGLDGASFNHFDPLLKSGQLPGFSKYFEKGVRSDCLSVIPPLTPPAWSTMMTGVNPGKHGIYDFIQPGENGVFKMVTGSWRKRLSFIKRAGNAGIRTLSLLVPYTFPADPETNGIEISGLGTPSAGSDFIRPHDLRDKFLKEFPHLSEIDPTHGRSLDNLHAHLENHTKETVRLIRESMGMFPDAGLVFAVFQATDFIPHFYSRYFDKNHPDYDPDEKVPAGYRNALSNIYMAIDPLVEEMMAEVENGGGHLILVSDHGSEPLIGTIGKDRFITDRLESLGFLKRGKEMGKAAQSVAAGAGSVANRLVYILKKYTPHGVRNAFNQVLGSKKEAISEKLSAIPFMENIKFEETKAFCAPGGYGVGIYINRKSLFSHGIVDDGAEYFKIRDEIKKGFECLEIESGVPLFNGVMYREDALWGESIETAPDLFLLWREDPALKKNGYKLSDGSSLDPPGTKSGTELIWCGTHRMEGLVGFFGDGVNPGANLQPIPSLTDIYPTIQMLAELKIPSDIDGKPITGAFTDDFLKSCPPEYGPPEGGGGGSQSGLDDSENEKMQDLLKGLGYLN